MTAGASRSGLGESGTGIPDILSRIIDARREDVARAKRDRPESGLRRDLREAREVRPSFGAVPLVIAECKKASPSKGVFLEDYDPAGLAAAYARGGAGMVSVLTEPHFFLGEDRHLSAVRAACALPALRKDFIVDPYQVRESWAIGADAILLIARILPAALMRELSLAARELGLAVLAEIHDANDLEKTLAAGADAIGVNSRNLADFSVDRERCVALRDSIPRGIFAVAESGIASPADAAALRAAGFDGFLVGEAFVRASDPEAAVRAYSRALAGGNPA